MSNLSELQQLLENDFEEIEGAFKGIYKDELERLSGLSKEEIAAISTSPNMVVYEKLKKVVQQASARNLSQAELKQNIEKLGNIAVEIAKVARILV